MSLPSVAKDKTSNKISLVTRPSVTLVQQSDPVIGTVSASQSQSTLIYVQSIQPSTQQPPLIGANQLNKPKISHSQPISIISNKTIRSPSNVTTINKFVTLPSTSATTNRLSHPIITIPNRQQTSITVPNRQQSSNTVSNPNRVQSIHFKSNLTNLSSVQSKTTPAIITQQVNVLRSTLGDKTPLTRITKLKQIPSTAVTTHLSVNTQSFSKGKSNIVAGEKIIRSGSVSASGAIAANQNKTVASNVTKIDPINHRYRTILENLLQLKNNFVRRTITQAIKQKLCNQSNEDLLNVIFKSFELTLLSVNVEQISLNETYLNATLAFLAKVIETGRFMELIENRRETKDIKKFVSTEMSTILNKVSLASVYKNARDIFEQKQRGSYAQILELLNKVMGLVIVAPDIRLSPPEIEFWLKDVMPMICDSDEDIQSNAIEAMNKAVSLLLASKFQTHPYWQQTRNTILNDYTQKIRSCFQQGNPKWYMVWCLCVRLLDVDIPRSASTLNAFLSIVEPALRSNVPIRRAEGYLCWRVLLEVLVRHNRLNSEKRLKLMCTPLKSLAAKTLEIARNKFQAWWYVLCNVQENVDNYISMVFEPFLQFCFGQLSSTPNLRLNPSESATQVKSFPTVSLMAVCSLLRMLDESDKQIDELFTKYSLIQPSHLILTDTIFSIEVTAALVINACAEATIMLNNLKKEANNNIDCQTLAVCLWTRLFKHVNRAKKTEHINLILDNVLQLMNICQNNWYDTRMIPLVCASVFDQIGSSFVFEPSENGEISENVSKTIAKFMNVTMGYPKCQLRLEATLSKLLAIPQLYVENFYQNFANFLTVIDEHFFKANEQINESVSECFDAPMMCCQFINCILTYIQLNADAFKAAIRPNTTDLRIPPVLFKIIYWPLLFSLSKDDFDVYTKTLLKTIDILLTMISKSDFCKESAIIIKNIIAKPNHCIYINDAIAMLFDYMVYDFDDIKEAPIEMLNLCALVIKKESKIVFQDLNSIAEALIKYRRAISQTQFDIIAIKMREVVKLIENENSNMRTERSLINDLKELVGAESIADKSPGQNNKSLRSSKNNRSEKDEFVVVNKVWKLEPSKLTEHQKEKMKTRRCDIPALYNDLSQSQDSVSIQEWTPKTMSKSLNNSQIADDENGTVPMIVDQETNESPASQRPKKNEKGTKNSPKRLNSSQSQTTNPNQDQCENVENQSSDDMNNSKRRMTRELNRIQIDAIVEDVPYNSLPESNRLTRSTVKKIEEKPDEKRKTRSDSTKTNVTDSNKKKSLRTSLTNSPLLRKQKVKSNSMDSEASGEPTPKRRLTRQTKTDESEDHDESMEDKKVNNKGDNKKTEFVDTFELKVEKLAYNLTSNNVDKIESDVKSDGILVETCTATDLQQTQTQNEIVADVETKMETDEKPDLTKEKEKEKQKEKDNEGVKMNMDMDMDVDEKEVTDEPIRHKISLDENKENVKHTTELITKTTDSVMKIQETEKSTDHHTEDGLTEAGENKKVLIETATISIDKECIPELKPEQNQSENSSDNEHEISSRSYMSALVFDGISPSRSLNGSTIVTSPEIDAPRSLEFLNDTLNISPIATEAKNDEVPNDQVKKNIAMDDDLEGIERMDDSMTQEKPEHDVKTEKPIITNDSTNEKGSLIKKIADNEIVKSVTASVPVPESPVIPTSKLLKQSVTIQSSTPLQSHQSPVSSKFKTQLVGRGAQLLKMINSNKSPKPASPTPATMIEHAFKTASPTINQLETAPICENIVNTPEQKSTKDRHSEKHEQNENGNFLTLSGVLPSPFESPGISILKRKSCNVSMDDSMHSPAPKRKRVSFGFPLSQTKEYIVDEDFTPYYMIPSNESPCRRANRLKKLKLKRNKHQTDSPKMVINDNKSVQSMDTNPTNDSTVAHGKDEEISVKQIQEYLGMDAESYRLKQAKQLADGMTSNASTKRAVGQDSNSDDSSTESNDDDPEIEAATQTSTISNTITTTATTTPAAAESVAAATQPPPSPPPPPAKTIADFSDEVIFAHLLSKYSPTDILKKLEPSIDAKVLTKRLSSMMSKDKQVEMTVLEELAEQHSDTFLEHAITENVCSVICDRLSMKSSNGINDYFADKINGDDQFASDFLDRVSVSVLRQKLMDIVTTSKREQHILLEDFLVSLKDYIRRLPRNSNADILPEHIHLWISKLFDQFKLTAEQYLQLTSIYIKKNPPAPLDHFD